MVWVKRDKQINQIVNTQKYDKNQYSEVYLFLRPLVSWKVGLSIIIHSIIFDFLFYSSSTMLSYFYVYNKEIPILNILNDTKLKIGLKVNSLKNKLNFSYNSKFSSKNLSQC